MQRRRMGKTVLCTCSMLFHGATPDLLLAFQCPPAAAFILPLECAFQIEQNSRVPNVTSPPCGVRNSAPCNAARRHIFAIHYNFSSYFLFRCQFVLFCFHMLENLFQPVPARPGQSWSHRLGWVSCRDPCAIAPQSAAKATRCESMHPKPPSPCKGIHGAWRTKKKLTSGHKNYPSSTVDRLSACAPLRRIRINERPQVWDVVGGKENRSDERFLFLFTSFLLYFLVLFSLSLLPLLYRAQ